jgi:hypothetical protein
MYYVADLFLDPDYTPNCILEELTFETVEEAKQSECYKEAQKPAVLEIVIVG